MTRPWASDGGPWSGKFMKEESIKARGRPKGSDSLPHTYSLGFDFAKSIGVVLLRDDGESAVEVLDLNLLKLPVDPKAKDEKAVSALIHSPGAWEFLRATVREIILSSFSYAHRQRQCQLVVAYERVDFAKAVYWAQLYGGITATLLGVLSEEVLRLGRADAVSVLPVNVSTAKAFFTGDPGASKQRMEHSFGKLQMNMPSRLRLRMQSFGKESHNVVDAFAIAAYALQQELEAQKCQRDQAAGE